MKERQSNIELLRIIAMIMIVLQHANYGALGAIEQVDVINNPAPSIIRMFIQQLCIVGVDVFILISGWFGIKPSLKGFLKLLYQILFFGLLILLIGVIAGLPLHIKDSLYVLFGGGYYWFIPAYLALYCLSPVLNAFVEKMPPRTVLNVLCLFFILEFAFGWITSHYTFNNGYSIVSFIGLYLLARFINSYPFVIKEKKPLTLFLAFAALTIIPVVLAFFGLKTLNRDFFPIDYCSPFVIAASLCLVIAFNILPIRNGTINWFACSVLPVYIVHQHPVLAQYFNLIMRSQYAEMSSIVFFVFTLLFAIVLLIVCVLVDKVRICSWELVCRSFLDKVIVYTERVRDKVYLKLGL